MRTLLLNPTLDKIDQCLRETFSPETLKVIDESAAHVGHAGARSGGGHFKVEISASAFEGKSLLESHQMIYQALGKMMEQEIHALRIKLL
jgi:BolA family transcriptional regulator, general stress-responsive regulator